MEEKIRRITPEVLPPEDERARGARKRVEAFAGFMDDSIVIPGIGVRVGWDGIFGLLPVVGDAVTLVLSFYVVLEAMRAGAPPAVITRMLTNIAADAAVGAVPVAGDLFDVAFRANRRNSRLLLNWLKEPERVKRHSRARVILLGVAVLLAVVAILVGGILLALWVARQVGLMN